MLVILYFLLSVTELILRIHCTTFAVLSSHDTAAPAVAAGGPPATTDQPGGTPLDAHRPRPEWGGGASRQGWALDYCLHIECCMDIQKEK
jgi:hypothetical protein